MNTQLKFILVALTGMSFWFYSTQNSNSVPRRGPASEDLEIRERYDEETDYYDSYQFQRDPSHPVKADGRPGDPNQKNKKMKKKSKDPIGDDVEWSKLDPASLLKLQVKNCKLGVAKECYLAGISQISTDKKSGIWYIGKACNLKYHTACLEAGKLLEVTDTRVAFPYYKSACENMNHPDACFAAAEFLNSQQKIDYETTEKFYKVSCLEGNDKACQRLGFENSENIIAAN